jgi:UDP-N-acetylglucosamine 2-epimerase (non-hydrolysing)
MKQPKKVYFFIGTVAELIKLVSVMRRFHDLRVPFEIIASGQNNICSEIELLRLAKAENVKVISISGAPNKQTALSLFVWFFKSMFKGLIVFWNTFSRKENRLKQSWLLVHGDTLSTVQGAILGKIFGFNIGHIEAGLRSFDFLNPFPEELDRVIVSYFADAYFCPNEWSVNNLKMRNGEKINTLQNTLVESLVIAIDQKKAFPVPEVFGNKYFVFVLHRQENVLNTRLVNFIVNNFLLPLRDMRCIFILYDFTKSVLEKMGLMDEIRKNKNIFVVPRLSYIDFMQVLNASEFVMTDGGSNQEECYYLGKPTLLLRKVTERIEGLGENVIISGHDKLIISSFIKNYSEYRRDPLFGVVLPSKAIVDYILSH